MIFRSCRHSILAVESARKSRREKYNSDIYSTKSCDISSSFGVSVYAGEWRQSASPSFSRHHRGECVCVRVCTFQKEKQEGLCMCFAWTKHVITQSWKRD